MSNLSKQIRLLESSKFRTMGSYLLLCIFLTIIMLLIIENGISNAESQFQQNNKNKIEKISINTTINPDAISVGGSGKLSITLSNLGNINTSVNSIQLSPPWNQTNFKQNILLSPNRTEFELITIKVPENVSSGKYSLKLKVSTQFRDYDASAILTVNRIETIPLSDNIPLSILVLVFSGVVTYSVATYIITHQFQRSYVEIALWSVGLGFLNWGILTALSSVLKIRTTLELIQYDFYAVVTLLIIGILVGLVVGIFKKYIISWMITILRENKVIKEQEKSYRQRGFWQSKSGEPVWPYFISEQWDFIKQKLGKTYSTTLKIHLKNPVNSKYYLTGILGTFEDTGPPYDIVIYPKYRVDVSSNEIIRQLRKRGEKGHNLIYEMFEEDSNYEKKVTRSMSKEFSLDSNTPYDLSNDILTELQNCVDNKDCDRFQKLLEKIDFSKYVRRVLKRMQQSPSIIYDGPVFIHGDNILNVELIRYESYESVRVTDCSNKIIPRVYEKSEFPLVVNVLAD